MSGTAITMENGLLNVPNDPVINYIEGDGIGVDITPVMLNVVNAVAKHTVANEALFGQKYWLGKRRFTPRANGFLKQRLTQCEPVLCQSKVH